MFLYRLYPFDSGCVVTDLREQDENTAQSRLERVGAMTELR